MTTKPQIPKHDPEEDMPLRDLRGGFYPLRKAYEGMGIVSARLLFAGAIVVGLVVCVEAHSPNARMAISSTLTGTVAANYKAIIDVGKNFGRYVGWRAGWAKRRRLKERLAKTPPSSPIFEEVRDEYEAFKRDMDKFLNPPAKKPARISQSRAVVRAPVRSGKPENGMNGDVSLLGDPVTEHAEDEIRFTPPVKLSRRSRSKRITKDGS